MGVMQRTSVGETFGTRLKWLRDVAGIESARAVDRILKRNPKAGSYTAMLEGGARKDPGIDMAVEYAELYGVTLDWLVRGKGSPPSPVRVRGSVARAA